jgi:DNA repair protein RecO (recombination protein O)
MAIYETEAILLAVKDWGDADRMVTLFSREYGKINAVAYGARVPRNSLSGPLQPFSHVNILLSQGNQLDYIKQCQVHNSFKEVREDIVIMAYALFLSEIVLELWPDREAEPKVFEFLIAAFPLISQRNPRIVSLAGAWKLLSLAGYQPLYEKCISCGKKLSFPAYFSLDPCGGLCEKCVEGNGNIYTEEMRDFIKQLLSIDWQNPGHFTVNKKTLLMTEKLVQNVLFSLIGKPLKSVSFITAVEG